MILIGVFLYSRFQVERLSVYKKVFKRRVYYFALCSMVLAALLQLYVVQFIHVGLLEALKRSIGMTMALVFGWILFKEELQRRKVLAVLLMAVGVIFIGW